MCKYYLGAKTHLLRNIKKITHIHKMVYCGIWKRLSEEIDPKNAYPKINIFGEK